MYYKCKILIPQGNNFQDQIKTAVDQYPDDFFGIKQQANKYLPNNSNIDESGTLNIFHRPWVAPYNWGVKLYQGAPAQWINTFEEKTSRPIPNAYKQFLVAINGCFIYDFSLFGLPPSAYVSGTLNRSLLQCLDLGLANTGWIKEYEINKNWFHFGSRAYNDEENIGYFFDGNIIKAVLDNGKIKDEWTNFPDFLRDEIAKAEKMMKEGIPKNTKVIINQ